LIERFEIRGWQKKREKEGERKREKEMQRETRKRERKEKKDGVEKLADISIGLVYNYKHHRK
jgi:hypothetical protein